MADQQSDPRGGGRAWRWARLLGIVTALDHAEPQLGEVVSGKYRLTRLIGRGGMGSVWEGVHLTLGNKVAVKFIDPAYAESPEARQRFENEARAAARLNSKYAVQVYDHGMMQDGRPFIVMEFLVGEPLDARLDRDGRLPANETAQILSQVSRALSRAHAVGIVHRDLKPENVFLVWDDEDQANVAKVVDFGIAKFTDNQAGISSSTRTGSVLGTPYYMSPEQARGLRSVDYRTDLWSLGVIAYRCIVGRLPFEGESVGDLLVKICTSQLPIPSQQAPGCPPGFDAWFARALERDPSARFVTAQELAEQLMHACGVASGRQAFPSSAQGFVAEFGTNTGGGVFSSATAGAGAGVAGVTGASMQTDIAFSKAKPGSIIPKSKTLLWIASAGVGLVSLVTIIVFLVVRRQPADARQLERDVSVAASAGAVSRAAAADPSALVIRSASPQVVVEPAASVQAAAPVGAPAEPSIKAQVAVSSRAPVPKANPSAQPARRPGNSRPIDVGY